jgi:transcriptional regulator with XRE-family HTH domain
MAKSEVELLKRFRATSGWSMDRIAKALGVHHQTVQAWLAGKKAPGNLSRQAIREFLKKGGKVEETRRVKPLMLDEFFTICGGDKGLMGKIANGAQGEKHVGKFILKALMKGMEQTVSPDVQKKFLARIDEDRANEILRDVAKKIAAGEVLPKAR